MQKLILFPALAALALSASAQDSQCPPTQTAATNPGFADLGNLNLSTMGANITEIGQFCMVPAGKPGVFLLSLTAKFTSGGAYGEKGGWDAISGVIDTNASPWGFTPDAHYAAGNTANDEFACNMSYDGLVAALDQGTAGGAIPVVMTRASHGVAFSNPKQIVSAAGEPWIVPATYVDCQLAMKGKDYWFLWIDTGPADMYCGKLDANPASPTYGQVTQTRLLQSSANQSAWSLNFYHSITPICDTTPNAATEGDWHMSISSAYASGAGSDCVFYDTDRDRKESEGHLLEDGIAIGQGTNWYANPAVVGGDAYYANAAAGYIDPIHVQFLAVSGANIPVGGGPVEVLVAYPSAAAGQLVFLNLGFQTPGGPISHPLITGGDLCVLPLASLSNPANPNGTTLFNLGMAPAVVAPGIALWAQALLFNPANGNLFLSNDAAVSYN